MIEEILRMGFSHVELGYDLTVDLVPGVKKLVEEKAVTVDTVHNFCPVPIGAPYGHPELFPLTSSDEIVRQSAIVHTRRTIDFAAQVHARVVVAHAGTVEMAILTRKLITLYEKGKRYSPRYERTKLKLLIQRDRKVRRHLDQLRRSVEELLPDLEDSRVQLALENLPTWESVPAETEMEDLLKSFNSPWLRYWHDTGHGQIRENLGFISHLHWFERLEPWLAGMHIHDVASPASDHLMPPAGDMEFLPFKKMARSGILLTLEPAPGTPYADVREGHRIVKEVWGKPISSEGTHG